MRGKGILFFLLLTGLPLCAQWDIVDEVFIPPTYYVGDSVLLQFRLVWDDEREVMPPEVVPQSEWLEIESVSVEQDGYEAQVTLRFRSYMTGTRSLPPLELGDIKVDSLKIFTTSLVEQEDARELRGIRDNLDFPGIKLLIPLFLILLVSAPYALFILLRYLAERFKVILRILASSGPRRKIRRLQKKLEKQVDDKGHEREFYIDFSVGLRIYLSERVSADFLSMTTRDMKSYGPVPVESSLWEEVTTLLKAADLVKFAGERISRKDKVYALAVLDRLIENLEKEEIRADL
ncbi:MAG: hypothetical protein PQJ60_00245 [Spirochaetales bacterium]|nr:hypothetical protein [Spirochaetales bacterium]